MIDPKARFAKTSVLACAALLLATESPADPGVGSAKSRPDAHAPLGVMGDHVHHAGEWMASYRYSRMRMDGNRDRESSRSVSDLFAQGFLVAPKDMDMEMHVFGLMYAPTDWLTLMAMLPFVELSMDHVTANGLRFTTKSDGPGDLKLSGLVSVLDRGPHHLHLNAGVSFPTGTLREEDKAPVPGMGLAETRLPYPMQIGSGTFDLLPGVTYTAKIDGLSWGAQAMGTVRLGRNKNDYRLGDRVNLTAWLARPWTDWLSTSFRVAWSHWGNINGRDGALSPIRGRPALGFPVPTADPNLRAGEQLDLLGGVNLLVPLGPLGEHRFAAEAGFPVHQSLDGPQLETDWRVVVGWQYAF